MCKHLLDQFQVSGLAALGVRRPMTGWKAREGWNIWQAAWQVAWQARRKCLAAAQMNGLSHRACCEAATECQAWLEMSRASRLGRGLFSKGNVWVSWLLIWAQETMYMLSVSGI